MKTITTAFLIIILSSAGRIIGQNTTPVQKTPVEIAPKPRQVIAKSETRPIKEEKEDIIAAKVDEMPEFKGGIDQFYALLKQPLYRLIREGRKLDKSMSLNYIIRKDGSMDDAKIVDKKGRLVTAAPELIKDMPYWRPGYVDGKAVSSRMFVPLELILTE